MHSVELLQMTIMIYWSKIVRRSQARDRQFQSLWQTFKLIDREPATTSRWTRFKSAAKRKLRLHNIKIKRDVARAWPPKLQIELEKLSMVSQQPGNGANSRDTIEIHFPACMYIILSLKPLKWCFHITWRAGPLQIPQPIDPASWHPAIATSHTLPGASQPGPLASRIMILQHLKLKRSQASKMQQVRLGIYTLCGSRSSTAFA